MKFSFVNPGPNETLLKGEKTMINASPPLGILYIVSMLKSVGVEVSALDQAAEGSSTKEVVDWVMKEDPDILGVSTLLTSSLTAPKIAEEVKKKTPMSLLSLETIMQHSTLRGFSRNILMLMWLFEVRARKPASNLLIV